MKKTTNLEIKIYFINKCDFYPYMKCIHCSATAKYKFTDKNLCTRCFCKVIEKRVRKYLRLGRFITKGDKVFVDGDVCKYFIDSIISFPMIKVKDKAKADKIIVPYTLDHKCLLFLQRFSEKNFDLDMWKLSEKKIVKLFMTIDEASLIEFCKIKKIKYEPIKDSKLKKELDKLVAKYPETKYSLGKSIEVLKTC